MASPDMPRGGLLEASELTVQFGGNTAVNAVSLRAEPGRITGLIGPNGAGKTTTFNVLCGLQGTTRGQVHLDGQDISSLAPHRRARLGVARTFQRLETFSLLTVRENVLAGAELRPRRFRNRGDRDEITDAVLAKLGLSDVADQRVDSFGRCPSRHLIDRNQIVEAVRQGCANLGRHIQNIKKFGVPAVVAINHFVSDTEAEIAAVTEYVETLGSEAVLCRHWAEGGAGIEDLARAVVEIIEGGGAQYAPLYPDEMGLFQKIETIAREIYRADEVLADKKIRDQLRQWEEQGYGNLPICMAKTQYSFSTDPNLRGAPVGHSVPVREVRLAAGAGGQCNDDVAGRHGHAGAGRCIG